MKKVLLIVMLAYLHNSFAASTKSETVSAQKQKKCIRAPAHAQPADAQYQLKVAGEPDLFLPGELYTVTLSGVDSGEGPTPFSAFRIWAEIVPDDDVATNESALYSSLSNHSLGIFQAYDAQTKTDDNCAPSVVNATSHPKIEVQVIWNPPKTSKEVCIRLCAQASAGTQVSEKMIILARKLCAAPIVPSSARQLQIVEPCCACDEAKYEVTFEGLWSRNMHPREFPPESFRAHFGDVIGASHTAQYRVWQEGRVASPGLRKLADDGSTTSLEKELKAESEHIRTIIKARGISWQQVASGSSPSTFAVFRVDNRNHLVSLATKLAPSPDWFVGVSALELCNVNCTWRKSTIVPLYPYDAGTDSGISYTSRRQTTLPSAPVRALRPDWPKDIRSPFYNTNGDLRPFARLRLTRLRLYEKSCDAVESPAAPLPSSESCAVGNWGRWSPCSTSCGEGKKSRQRHYLNAQRAKLDGCRVPLTQHEHCFGPRRHCRAPSEYEPSPALSVGPCAVSPWSNWSSCDGCGMRSRQRTFLLPRAIKRCSTGYMATTILHQAMPCDMGPCNRNPIDSTNSTDAQWVYVDNPNPACRVSPWSDWSPCLSRCGPGRRLRSRLYITRDDRMQAELTKRLMKILNRRILELQGVVPPVPDKSANESTLHTDFDSDVEAYLQRCQFTMTQQESSCEGRGGNCPISDSKDICHLNMSVGYCRGYTERWFFDMSTKLCEPFGYTGCGGNANNFETRYECLDKCSNDTDESSDANVRTAYKDKEESLQSQSNSDRMQNDYPASVPPVDCKVSSWYGWSRCLGDCSRAYKFNYRIVQTKPTPGGEKCPHLVKSRRCVPKMSCSFFKDTHNQTKLKVH